MGSLDRPRSASPLAGTRNRAPEAAAGRTRLIIDHRGLGSSSTGYGAGWQAYLDGGLRAEIGIAAAESWDTLFAHALPAWQQRAASLA